MTKTCFELLIMASNLGEYMIIIFIQNPTKTLLMLLFCSMFSVSNTFQALKWNKLMSCMSYFSSVARQSFVRTHTRSYSRRWRTKKDRQLWSTWRLQIEDHKNIQRRRKNYSTTRNSIYRHSQREYCDQIPYSSSLVEVLYSIPERSRPRPRLFVVRLHRGRQTSIILL